MNCVLIDLFCAIYRIFSLRVLLCLVQGLLRFIRFRFSRRIGFNHLVRCIARNRYISRDSRCHFNRMPAVAIQINFYPCMSCSVRDIDFPGLRGCNSIAADIAGGNAH